jgi:hypothetical protein
MPSSRLLRSVVLVRTDVSEECSVSIIRVTRIGEIGTTLAVSGKRRTLRQLNVVFYANFTLIKLPAMINLSNDASDILVVVVLIIHNCKHYNK